MASAAEGRPGRGAADGAERARLVARGGRGRPRRRFGGAGGRSETSWDEPAGEGAGSRLARGVAALETLEPGR